MIKAHSYLSPKLDLTKQNGVCAISPIKKGEVLSVWNGVFVNKAQLNSLSEPDINNTVQIEDDVFLAPAPDTKALEPTEYIKHSCDPTAGLSGQLTLLALRDIGIGEKISFDAATANSCEEMDFACDCSANNCRGYIYADDWKKPEIQEKYRGYFMPYIQRKLDKLARK